MQIILANTALVPAAKKSVAGILKNILPLLMFLVWICLFAVPLIVLLSIVIFATIRMGVSDPHNASLVSSGVMLVPMAFLIMPILLGAQYAVYATLFEGTHPDQILAKPQTTA
jgi:hypothetical protein